jgi:hypothetical protein
MPDETMTEILCLLWRPYILLFRVCSLHVIKWKSYLKSLGCLYSKLGKNLEITHTATALQLFKGCDCKDKTGKTQKQLNKAVGMAIKEIEQGQTKKSLDSEPGLFISCSTGRKSQSTPPA